MENDSMGTLIEQPAPTQTIFSIKNTRSCDSQAAGIRAKSDIYLRTIFVYLEYNMFWVGEGEGGLVYCRIEHNRRIKGERLI